jgi:hypothetical protein
MKVSELIAELQKLPQDAKVIMTSLANRNQDPNYDYEVRDVILNDKFSSEPMTVELDNWPKDFL